MQALIHKVLQIVWYLVKCRTVNVTFSWEFCGNELTLFFLRQYCIPVKLR